MMLWLVLAILVIVGAAVAFTRHRRYESIEDEPWRASLDEDEPLDLDQARRAEEEFLADEWQGEEDEPWRG